MLRWRAYRNPHQSRQFAVEPPASLSPAVVIAALSMARWAAGADAWFIDHCITEQRGI